MRNFRMPVRRLVCPTRAAALVVAVASAMIAARPATAQPVCEPCKI
jgi:hypothetical protein